MRPNPQDTADMVTYSLEILTRKLHFLCSETCTFNEYFTFIAKVYPVHHFLTEIQKHNMNLSIFFSLLLCIVADFTLKVHQCKICQYIRLHICQRFHIITFFYFLRYTHW